VPVNTERGNCITMPVNPNPHNNEDNGKCAQPTVTIGSESSGLFRLNPENAAFGTVRLSHISR